MSKQLSKNQASRSHPEESMPGVYGTRSKESLKPAPAHESVRDNIDVDESKGGVGKKKAAPAHVGPQNQPGQERDSLNEKQINRVSRPVPGDAKEVPGAAARARQETHGKLINADGTSQATPGTKVARLV